LNRTVKSPLCAVAERRLLGPPLGKLQRMMADGANLDIRGFGTVGDVTSLMMGKNVTQRRGTRRSASPRWREHFKNEKDFDRD
jgi:hypothetical protein